MTQNERKKASHRGIIAKTMFSKLFFLLCFVAILEQVVCAPLPQIPGKSLTC